MNRRKVVVFFSFVCLPRRTSNLPSSLQSKFDGVLCHIGQDSSSSSWSELANLDAQLSHGVLCTLARVFDSSVTGIASPTSPRVNQRKVFVFRVLLC